MFCYITQCVIISFRLILILGDIMKNTQKIIFIVVFFIACFSAYSLAQMNQVRKIDFTWNKGDGYVSDKRLFFGQYKGTSYPTYMDFDIISSMDRIININGHSIIKNVKYPNFDEKSELLIFATLGEISDGYSIKIKDIAQRGNIIEVLVDIGQPSLINFIPYKKTYPYDIVKVSKDNLQFKDGLLFIFKDYDGNEIFKKHYNLEPKNNI